MYVIEDGVLVPCREGNWNWIQAWNWSSVLCTYGHVCWLGAQLILYLFGCKTRVFPLNLALRYEVILNLHMKCWTGLHQTRSLWTGPREVCILMRYYSGNSAPTFWGNLSLSASKVKKSKGQNRAWGKLTDTFFSWGWGLRLIFKEALSFRSRLFPFVGKAVPNLVDPLDWVILNHWALQQQYLVEIHTWEQI